MRLLHHLMLWNSPGGREDGWGEKWEVEVPGLPIAGQLQSLFTDSFSPV